MLEIVTTPTVDLTNSGLQHGHGLFETIRIEANRPVFLQLHLERLADGLQQLNMPALPSDAVVGKAVQQVIDQAQSGTLKLVAVDGQLYCWFSDRLPHPQTPVSIMLSEALTRFSGSPVARLKSLSYLESKLLAAEAEQAGLYESIALNERGQLTEGSRTNLFLVIGDSVVTPPVADGLLPGTVREQLLRHAGVRERSLDIQDLMTADAAFLTNALVEVTPIGFISGGTEKPREHPLIDDCQRCLARLKAEQI